MASVTTTRTGLLRTKYYSSYFDEHDTSLAAVPDEENTSYTPEVHSTLVSTTMHYTHHEAVRLLFVWSTARHLLPLVLACIIHRQLFLQQIKAPFHRPHHQHLPAGSSAAPTATTISHYCEKEHFLHQSCCGRRLAV
ncbi:hypothetical protein M419DRAFT_123726 [Trichoderma reesei RUT C-30]|uniref:Uncharacterized protein n=1 Tax=Hypocrea jecorina (strain ATCC 56765 / BCRC 32924 / NRRL 11460 / Rut C-30) TaxID=1344414 RepID=A0A024SAS8_HYPJR|nr:hypothetical protein M419DRAFT_123726 [Trichoderma reesei RUT C-30]